MKYKTTEDIGCDDYPWLEDDIEKGTIVYSFTGCTYGCISPYGTAFTFTKDALEPFFELPDNSVEKVVRDE